MGVDLKASDKIELKTCDTQKPYVFVSYSKQDKDVVYACCRVVGAISGLTRNS